MNLNKKRRVLFVHDGPIYKDFHNNYYGIHLTGTLVQRYLNLGDEVTFLIRVENIPNNKVERFSRIADSSFSVIELPNFKSIRLYLKYHRLAKRIIKLAVDNYDIIVCRLPSASGTIALNHSLKLCKPVLVEYVACTFDAYWNYNCKGKIIAHYKRQQQRRIMRKAPYSIYVTESFLQKRYPPGGKSIACSDVELQEINNEDMVNRLSRILTKPKGHPLTIGTVAALNVPYKGQTDVIKAIAILKNQGYICNYHLVGQGNPEKIMSLAQKLGVVDQVEIVGTIHKDEVFNFFRNIDLYIHPSRQEGLPRAVVEALSVACPILGSNTGGIPELIDPNMIFRPGNINEITRKILRLTNEELAIQAKTNFEKAKKYENKILNERRTKFYKEFLAENQF